MTRQAGHLVLGIAALVLVAAVNQRPHMVAGSAQALPVPGPPEIGTCVLDPLPIALPNAVLNQTSALSTAYQYPQLNLQPCDGARYGEVVTVIPHPRPPVIANDANGVWIDDPNMTDCYPQSQQYLGSGVRPLFGYWTVTLEANLTISRPSVRQEAADQRWVACVVGLQPTDGTTTISTSPRYDGSLRNALVTGRERNALGSCDEADDPEGAFPSGACGRPHSLERLAVGNTGNNPATRAQLVKTCQQLAQQLTGKADPTAAGALSVQLLTFDSHGEVVTTPQLPAHSDLQCSVTTTSRQLTGSLLALRHEPIPWA